MALTASSIPWLSAPAHAHPHRACVVTNDDALLSWCRYYRCRRPVEVWVEWGRAFRVKGQLGRLLLVGNDEMKGWIDIRAVDLVSEDYCRAAGI
jgi:hypothetical protein